MTISHADAGKLLDESLKKAASCAKQMSKLQNNNMWDVIAIGLEKARENGKKLVTNKAISRLAVLQSLEEHVDKKKVH